MIPGSFLPWLMGAPANFRADCRRLEVQTGLRGAQARYLATFALDVSQLERLGRSITAIGSANADDLRPLCPFKLGIIGNGTLDNIVACLVASAARHGIALECVTANYGVFAQEALDPQSKLNSAACDAVLIALDYRGLPLPARLPAPGEDDGVSQAVDLVHTLRNGFRSNSGAISIVQTLAPPPDLLFGSADRLIPGTQRYNSVRFNALLSESLAGSGDIMLDVAAIADTVGLQTWHSPKQWNIAKLPFEDACVPLYADHVARLLAALRGKTRRALVLDLDNTLWGGVIGDDGIAGIQLGEGDATGEAYASVQRFALSLRERGIALAVSSKNDDGIAREVFRSHPDMILKEEHIAVFQANWTDKATNIKALAAELSLGLESLVFLDDNPVERNLVRQLLPEVAVPELPDDPALYARTLSLAGYFEATNFLKEDRERADAYSQNARRAVLQSAASDIRSYLASLKMTMTAAPFDAVGRARHTQLINKSNQFNLTTRRYTEAEVADLESDPAVFTLQVRLADVFGDNGMISVVICRATDELTWDIDTWLMSCRVLGRGVEQAVLDEIVAVAKAHGISELTGSFVPTTRNNLVREHYSKLGFSPAGNAGKTTLWSLATVTHRAADVPIKKKRAFEEPQ